MEHQVGATHFALSLCNYLQNKQRKRTAYIELNPGRQIRTLAPKATGSSFGFLGFEIYPEVTLKELPSIYGKKYDYFILDMGTLGPGLMTEFLRCQQKFVICSVAPWRRQRIEHWMDKVQATHQLHLETVSIFGNMSKKKDLNDFEHRYHLPIQAIPFLENPFQLTSPDIGFFEQILQRN